MRQFVFGRKSLLVITIFLVVMLSYSYSYLVGNKRVPPYLLMKKFEDIFLKSHEVDFKVNPEVSNVDVRGIIQIINETNIFDKRNKLIKYIWGD